MTNLFQPTEPDTSHGVPVSLVAAAEVTVMERIYRGIEADMALGVLCAGQRLPSVRAMAARHGISRDTVLRAYDKLIAQRRIYAVRGSGFYVAHPVSPQPAAASPAVLPPLDPHRLIHSDHPLDRTPGSGILRHEGSAQAEVARVLRAVVASIGSDGSYGDPLGYLPLRRQLRDKLMGDGIEAPIESIVTTPGCIAGLSLVVRALLRPGNWAVIEAPASFMHLRVLMTQGANVAHVPRDADGPDLDVLRALCERHRPTMFLLSSVLHNPTGTCIAPYRAQKLIEIAAEFGMILVDDNSYADLLPPSGAMRPAMPLMLLDRMEQVIHVGGFSHTIAPATGPGFVVAHERWMRLIRHFRPAQGLGNTIVQERLVYRFLHEGLYRRRCERIRTHLSRCSLALGRTIAAAGLPPVVPPAHGLFLWMALGDGVDAGIAARRMLAKGYLTAPAIHFSPREEERGHMRLNVTTTTAAAMLCLRESV